jgi:hypothetical protein
MSHLRDRYRHRAGRENAPVKAYSRAHSLHSNRRGAGLYPDLSSKGVLSYSATKRMTVLRTARERDAPVGREKMDVSSRRVSSTQASRGRWSRRSEMPSCGDFVGMWVCHQFFGRGLSRRVFSARGCWSFGFGRSPLWGCCGFWRKLFRLGRLDGGCHTRLLKPVCDWLRIGFGRG